MDSNVDFYVDEIERLKEENRTLAKDNQELRDLCCFLDDDRQKSKRLAREWQKFGKHTAKVMREELDNYRLKLKVLDSRQQELIKDNYELKDLCIYLDEERNLVEEISCPHCSNVIAPPRSSAVASFSQQIAALATASASASAEVNSLRNKEMFSNSSEDDACGDSISSSNETFSSTEDNHPPVTSSRMLRENRNHDHFETENLSTNSRNYLQEISSSETNSYLREIDERRMNLPKVKEVISIFEQTNELADQRDNLKAILEEMCTVVLKSLETSYAENVNSNSD